MQVIYFRYVHGDLEVIMSARGQSRIITRESVLRPIARTLSRIRTEQTVTLDQASSLSFAVRSAFNSRPWGGGLVCLDSLTSPGMSEVLRVAILGTAFDDGYLLSRQEEDLHWGPYRVSRRIYADLLGDGLLSEPIPAQPAAEPETPPSESTSISRLVSAGGLATEAMAAALARLGQSGLNIGQIFARATPAVSGLEEIFEVARQADQESSEDTRPHIASNVSINMTMDDIDPAHIAAMLGHSTRLTASDVLNSQNRQRRPNPLRVPVMPALRVRHDSPFDDGGVVRYTQYERWEMRFEFTDEYLYSSGRSRDFGHMPEYGSGYFDNPVVQQLLREFISLEQRQLITQSLQSAEYRIQFEVVRSPHNLRTQIVLSGYAPPEAVSAARLAEWSIDIAEGHDSTAYWIARAGSSHKEEEPKLPEHSGKRMMVIGRKREVPAPATVKVTRRMKVRRKLDDGS